jgi:hypothetical protein
MGGFGSGQKRDLKRDAAMAKLRRRGWTLAEIGARFGLTRQAVKKAMDRLGVPVPRRPAKELRRKARSYARLPSVARAVRSSWRAARTAGRGSPRCACRAWRRAPERRSASACGHTGRRPG